MLEGVNLSLFVGPAVPVPVSRDVLDALESVEVTTSAGRHSGFKLTFKLSTTSPLHALFLVAGGTGIPLVRVVVMVTLNGQPDVLIDGVMTHHEVGPGPDAHHAMLTVIGEDLTRVMDYIDFSGIPYPGLPAEGRVALALLKYAVFGCVPLVVPSVLLDVDIPTEKIAHQQGTDLQYVSCLAERVGYTFYVEPSPIPMTSIAYWGPEIRIGVPQPALNIDMGAHTNVTSMSFRFDNTRKAMPFVYIHEPITKAPIPVPIPDVTPLSPPLGAIPPIPNRFEQLTGTSKLSLLQAAAIGLTKAAKSADAVSGSGSLDVLRYGRVLKARRLVGVRGAGYAFDGLYFVSSVTHKIKRGEYHQDFTVVRNGLVSTIPRVLP
jgi:hypothetical protein